MYIDFRLWNKLTLSNDKYMYWIKKGIHKIAQKSSLWAVPRVAKLDAELYQIWEISKKYFPHFKKHFTQSVDDEEIESRIRLLVAFETLFMKKAIDTINREVTYADVGDSDGSVRLLLSEFFAAEELNTIGINLQPQAVEKMKKQGLNAICADAMKLGEKQIHYDFVSLFETLEHLPDPIGFLKGIQPIVKEELIISIPLIVKSRVGLKYLSPKWRTNKKATIENQHIFELSPVDWEKVFNHAGWKIIREEKLKMYPDYSPHRLILQPYWRYMSFEGFWFVALKKDTTYSSKYSIE
jgi:2-polyprenyl-3-methyl-5-hydroxy-6-metoxy-1,4-benzoquinol methylase